ncbi:MAG: TetR/AcrR family transcriptional regulator, partial [Bacteroidetes bacterium]|nr:TetR/AcrR family transcriptional regulator [Bacteroidota bacterium]
CIHLHAKLFQMEIRDKIISGSSKMFIKFGIRSITMDMIAEQLGISKRTIYENFKDKDELVYYCLEDGIVRQKAIAKELFETSENIIDAMLKIIKHNINTLKAINPLFFFDLQKYYSELCKSKIKKNDKQNLSDIIDLLNKGIKEKIFRNEINVEIVAILISEQFKMIGGSEVFSEEKFSKAEIFENISINFIRGIVTEKGLSMVEKYKS